VETVEFPSCASKASELCALFELGFVQAAERATALLWRLYEAPTFTALQFGGAADGVEPFIDLNGEFSDGDLWPWSEPLNALWGGELLTEP
jgi:hypothetical protein